MKQRIIFALSYVAAGLVCGYLIFDDSKALRRAQIESKRLKELLFSQRKGPVVPTAPIKEFFPPRIDQLVKTNQVSKESDEKPRMKKLADTSFMSANGLSFGFVGDEKLLEEKRFELHQEYMPIFEQFGFNKKGSEYFVERLVDVFEASIEAENSIGKLSSEKHLFDNHLHQTMTEEQYELYKAYENQKTAFHELDLINGYLQDQEMPLIDVSLTDSLIQLLIETEAYGDLPVNGPFDSMPDYNDPGGARDIVRFQSSANELMTKFERLGTSEEQMDSLYAYYAARYDHKQRGLEGYSRFLENKRFGPPVPRESSRMRTHPQENL